MLQDPNISYAPNASLGEERRKLFVAERAQKQGKLVIDGQFSGRHETALYCDSLGNRAAAHMFRTDMIVCCVRESLAGCVEY